MKILIATALAALVGIGLFASVDTSPASAAAVVVKIGPGHHHWQSRWYWHGRYWHHLDWMLASASTEACYAVICAKGDSSQRKALLQRLTPAPLRSADRDARLDRRPPVCPPAGELRSSAISSPFRFSAEAAAPPADRDL